MKHSDIQKIKTLELILLILVLLFVNYIPPAIKTYKNLNATETAYFDFSKGAITNNKETWDISFNKTTIDIKNGAQLLDKNFDQLSHAPSDGYIVDGQSKKAVPAGSGNGWYKYSMMDHSINPLPGKTLVIKTSDNRYVKMEILSYYKDMDGESGYYTFRYAFIEL